MRLVIEIWVTGKSGTKRKGRKSGGGGKGAGVLWPLCVLGCISAVAVEGACVRDCRGWGCVQLAQ
jgi:hypothetical protein